jgi:mannose-6-phosphate isomerase
MPHIIFEQVAERLQAQGLNVVGADYERPWGGFFYIDETQIRAFAAIYFPHLTDQLPVDQKMSPKILVVAPHKRLSWQYHHRRSEVWRVVDGPVAVAISPDDSMTEPQTCVDGTFITLATGERHRLIGLDDWGVVAEIWQHTDPEHPSDEEDIVRLQDDFKRN